MILARRVVKAVLLLLLDDDVNDDKEVLLLLLLLRDDQRHESVVVVVIVVVVVVLVNVKVLDSLSLCTPYNKSAPPPLPKVSTFFFPRFFFVFSSRSISFRVLKSVFFVCRERETKKILDEKKEESF